MAEMKAKYGVPSDIEDKPEWVNLEKAQHALFDELYKLTSTPKEILFEAVQEAMFKVLGNEETLLSDEQAQEIVQETVRLALAQESQQAQAMGRIN